MISRHWYINSLQKVYKTENVWVVLDTFTDYLGTNI